MGGLGRRWEVGRRRKDKLIVSELYPAGICRIAISIFGHAAYTLLKS